MDGLVLAENQQSREACGLWAGSAPHSLRHGVPAKAPREVQSRPQAPMGGVRFPQGVPRAP